MKGGCHCKAVQFETSGEPFWTGSCYCTDCQKISGTGYMTFVAYKKDQVVFQGNPREYASSEKVNRSFCENCGSPILYVNKEHPDNLFLSIGLFDDQNSFKVQKHIWTKQKPAWVHICDDAPQG